MEPFLTHDLLSDWTRHSRDPFQLRSDKNQGSLLRAIRVMLEFSMVRPWNGGGSCLISVTWNECDVDNVDRMNRRWIITSSSRVKNSKYFDVHCSYLSFLQQLTNEHNSGILSFVIRQFYYWTMTTFHDLFIHLNFMCFFDSLYVNKTFMN